MRMGFHLPSSVFLGLSPPPSLTTEDERREDDDNNHNSVTTLDTTASTDDTSSTSFPESPRVVLTPVNHPSPEQQPPQHHGRTTTHHATSPTTSPPPQQQQQQQRLQREWKQKSIVRRASSIVQSEVRQMIQHSTFLNRPDIVVQQQSSSTTIMALFHRSEVQIGSLVGSGGFSNVYRITGFVLDPTISEQCTVEQEMQRVIMADRVARGEWKLVVKHLKQSLAHSSTKVMSRAAIDLIMEATYMSSMNHPHILPIRALPVHHIHAYDAGDYDGYFIIMDELSNTLSDEIQEWKTNVTTAPSVMVKMDYALQIASALSYLHTFCQVVYRDLKPSNIGFDINTGTIQIFDFGLCRELPTSMDTPPPLRIGYEDASTDIEIEDDVYEMSGVGTRRYMAPEIINDGKYNTKVDVYSWSMLVSELITGIKPYVNYDIETHRVAVCQGGERPHLPFSLYPPWVRTILHHTWCESVTERWSARQVQYYLSKIIREYDDDEIRTRSERLDARPNLQPPLPQFPDSPVDVRRLHEIDIYAAADWLLLPDLPDLQNENCSTPGNIAPKRRHTLHPRYGHDDSSGLRFRPTIDGSTSTDPPPPLTICEVNGNVEVVFRQIPTAVPPMVTPRPFSFQQQYRANSCTVN